MNIHVFIDLDHLGCPTDARKHSRSDDVPQYLKWFHIEPACRYTPVLAEEIDELLLCFIYGVLVTHEGNQLALFLFLPRPIVRWPKSVSLNGRVKMKLPYSEVFFAPRIPRQHEGRLGWIGNLLISWEPGYELARSIEHSKKVPLEIGEICGSRL